MDNKREMIFNHQTYQYERRKQGNAYWKFR